MSVHLNVEAGIGGDFVDYRLRTLAQSGDLAFVHDVPALIGQILAVVGESIYAMLDRISPVVVCGHVLG